MPSLRFNLNFLMYPCEEDPSKTVAHCLQMDVVAVGANKPEAIRLLKELLEDLIITSWKDGTFDKIMNPAPKKYWEMFANAKPYRAPQSVVNHRIRARPIRRVDYAFA